MKQHENPEAVDRIDRIDRITANPANHVDPVQWPLDYNVPVAVTPEGFQKLDKRVVQMWTTTASIGSGLLLLAGIAGGVALWRFAGVSLLIIIPGWLALALNFFLETRWLPRKRYESTCYRIGDGFFEFRSGLVWKTSVMIPISRLQHIDLLRGPWEQHFGLATLDLHTAGTSKASQKVPGLEAGVAIRIREELIAAADLEPIESREDRGKE